MHATITAVAAGSITLSVDGQLLTLPLPAGLTLPSSLVGTHADLTPSFAGGEATAAAEQGDDQQGDQESSRGDDSSGGDNGSGDQDADGQAAAADSGDR